MEIAGHEFWGQDGETIWYDWQLPKGEDFWLGGFDMATNKRMAYHMQRDEWSIHFNVNKGATLFSGDGGDSGQVARSNAGEWIDLFHPEWRKDENGLNEPTFWKPGMFHREKLVNMSHHNYRLEPNVRFSPDSKLIFFTSNMFGPSYVFAVEVAKAAPGASDVQSTPELGQKVFSRSDTNPCRQIKKERAMRRYAQVIQLLPQFRDEYIRYHARGMANRAGHDRGLQHS